MENTAQDYRSRVEVIFVVRAVCLKRTMYVNTLMKMTIALRVLSNDIRLLRVKPKYANYEMTLQVIRIDDLIGFNA